jgi:hypothetical protein
MKMNDTHTHPFTDDDWVDNRATAATSPLEFEVEDAVVDESGGDEEDLNEAAAADGGGIGSSLVWKSHTGTYEFAVDPFKHSVWVILFLRFVERSSWYGYMLINPGFLTGELNNSLLLYCSVYAKTKAAHIEITS